MNKFALKVSDDRMKKFRIEAGDIVYIDTTLEVNSGDIVAVQFPGENGLTLRRMIVKPSKYIIFESSGMPEIYEQPYDNAPLIIGKVTAFSREI